MTPVHHEHGSCTQGFVCTLVDLVMLAEVRSDSARWAQLVDLTFLDCKREFPELRGHLHISLLDLTLHIADVGLKMESIKKASFFFEWGNISLKDKIEQ